MKKIILMVLTVLVSTMTGVVIMVRIAKVPLEEMKKMSDKHLALYLLMNQWVRLKQEGKDLSTYFKKNGYEKIAIYGMSYAGKTLIEELKNTNIKVLYGIDNNAKYLSSKIKIITMEEELKNVDAIVITAISFFDEIKKELSSKISCPIISLEDIIFET